jgi:hypothetical protein
VWIPELFTAVLIVGISAINLALPVMAWSRSGEPRFFAVAASNAVLVALGAVWTWGELPWGAPGWMSAPLPILLLVLLVTALILVSTLIPSRR